MNVYFYVNFKWLQLRVVGERGICGFIQKKEEGTEVRWVLLESFEPQKELLVLESRTECRQN